MKNEKSLKLLAKIAKKRLKNQNETALPSRKEALESDEEKKIADKILNMLKSNYDTPAPLMELIDQKKFNHLSPLEREIYIFELIEKYHYYKDWYDNKKDSLVVQAGSLAGIMTSPLHLTCFFAKLVSILIKF